MADADLERRVRILEENMDGLRDVPRRLMAVEFQIVQLRGEMQGGFSALQTQMQALNEQTRADMVRLNEQTRAQMRALHEDVIARIALMHERRSDLTPGSRRPRKKRR